MIIEDCWTELRMHEQDYRCAYCGSKFREDVTDLNAVHDFAWPTSREGQYSYDNTVAACFKCSLLKGELTGLEYLEALAFIKERNINIDELMPVYDKAA